MKQTKTTILTILIGLISLCGLVAQDQRKDWTDGKLTWDDFSERISLFDRQQVSELRYFLGYNTERQRFGDTVVLRHIAYAYVDRHLSWIIPVHKTEQNLRYNQVIFDIVEIHRRRLQIELDRVKSAFEIGGKFQNILHSLTRETELFQKESEYGNNLNAIVFWEQRVASELYRFRETPIPEFENRNFGLGFYLGLGTNSFTGSLGTHFSSTFNCNFGYDIAYQKHTFHIGVAFGGGTVRKDYTSKYNWQKGQGVVTATAIFSYGYAFVDNNKLKITPFVGIGVTEFSRWSQSGILDRLMSENVVLGVNADHKLRTWIKITPDPLWGLRQKGEISIRARLFIARTDFAPNLNGYSINLSLSFGGFGNFIRLK